MLLILPWMYFLLVVLKAARRWSRGWTFHLLTRLPQMLHYPISSSPALPLALTEQWKGMLCTSTFAGSLFASFFSILKKQSPVACEWLSQTRKCNLAAILTEWNTSLLHLTFPLNTFLGGRHTVPWASGQEGCINNGWTIHSVSLLQCFS